MGGTAEKDEVLGQWFSICVEWSEFMIVFKENRTKIPTFEQKKMLGQFNFPSFLEKFCGK